MKNWLIGCLSKIFVDKIKDSKETLGDTIRISRIRIKMKQGELAKILGITPTAVCTAEKGKTLLCKNNIIKISRILCNKEIITSYILVKYPELRELYEEITN